MLEATYTKLKNHFTANRKIEENRTPLLSESTLDASGFQSIGNVDHFIIYPIDCGLGFKFKTAICTKNGIQMIGADSKHLVDDRTLVVFNTTTKKVLLHPKFTISNNKSNEILLYCFEQYFKERNRQLVTVKVNYLGTIISLRCLPPGSKLEEDIQTKLFNQGLLQLGYCTKEERRLLNEEYRFKPQELDNWDDDKIKQAFLPNFSNYTLINTSSFEKICGKKHAADDVNLENFRPQIVTNLLYSFAEDNVEEVKVGDLIFDRITPCVVDATNYNPKCAKNKFSTFYDNLKSIRTLHSIYPGFSKAEEPVLPVFGINMELTEDPNKIISNNNTIKQGDIISVKYRKSAFLKPLSSDAKPVSKSDSAYTSASTSASTSN